ncbi:MAG: AbrB/MazE/SpoVT family DNA-binding domain-containing protein [Methanocellales archaeon]|nr:AbrB/MazE/SpoVT family DNA-binding domain-containing protein [Methanocellales archaeon]
MVEMGVEEEVSIVKLGEKGQITMPISIRQREKLKKGTLLEVVDLGEGGMFLTKVERKQELLLAMRMLGRALLEKGYNTDRKIIELCRRIREEVYDEKSKSLN